MRIVSITDIGLIREINQDYLYATEEPIGKLPNLFIVADGMGGHKAGEYASRLAVESVVGSIAESDLENPIEIIDRAVISANQLLLEYSSSDKDMQGMGTTMVVATLYGNHLIVANVGDSRLYIVNKTDIKQLTVDHSLVQEMVKLGELDEEAARTHPERNIITRALGVEKLVEADFYEADLQSGDACLLCTDGLYSLVDNHQIHEILNKDKEAEKLVEELVNRANNNGGKDNITVMLVVPDEVV